MSGFTNLPWRVVYNCTSTIVDSEGTEIGTVEEADLADLIVELANASANAGAAPKRTALTHTRTYVKMALSQSAFDEIKRCMEEADYGHTIHKDGDEVRVDMHGIAVVAKEPAAERIAPDDHHITMREFEDCVESGGFTDDDGFGELATATYKFPDLHIHPSDFDEHKAIDLRYTHVVWYNK